MYTINICYEEFRYYYGVGEKKCKTKVVTIDEGTVTTRPANMDESWDMKYAESWVGV